MSVIIIINIYTFFNYSFDNEPHQLCDTNKLSKCYLIDKACQILNNKVAVILSEIKILSQKEEPIVYYPGAINFCLKT